MHPAWSPQALSGARDLLTKHKVWFLMTECSEEMLGRKRVLEYFKWVQPCDWLPLARQSAHLLCRGVSHQGQARACPGLLAASSTPRLHARVVAVLLTHAGCVSQVPVRTGVCHQHDQL